jgi:hypothetical protein
VVVNPYIPSNEDNKTDVVRMHVKGDVIFLPFHNPHREEKRDKGWHMQRDDDALKHCTPRLGVESKKDKYSLLIIDY